MEGKIHRKKEGREGESEGREEEELGREQRKEKNGREGRKEEKCHLAKIFLTEHHA